MVGASSRGSFRAWLLHRERASPLLRQVPAGISRSLPPQGTSAYTLAFSPTAWRPLSHGLVGNPLTLFLAPLPWLLTTATNIAELCFTGGVFLAGGFAVAAWRSQTPHLPIGLPAHSADETSLPKEVRSLLNQLPFVPPEAWRAVAAHWSGHTLDAVAGCLTQYLHHVHWPQRMHALRALGALMGATHFRQRYRCIDQVTRCLDDEIIQVRQVAAEVLVACLPSLPGAITQPMCEALGRVLMEAGGDLSKAIYKRLFEFASIWGASPARAAAARVLFRHVSLLQDDRRDAFGPGEKAKVFANLASGMPEDPSARVGLVERLNDSQLPLAEAELLAADLVCTYGNALSYGTFLECLWRCRRIARGEISSLLLPGEGQPPPVSIDTPLGDTLHRLLDDAREQEQRLWGYPTLGGKARGASGSVEMQRLYPASGELLGAEGMPLALWPVRSPQALAGTIWELLLAEDKVRVSAPFYRLSITISGSCGEDPHFKLAALAVQAITPVPFPFATVKGGGVLGNLAPVVEGGSGGPVGFINLNGGPVLGGRLAERRYDHLFLQFRRPPSPARLRPETNNPWWAGYQHFLAEAQPHIILTPERIQGPQDRWVEVEFTLGEERVAGTWYPTRSDWQAMVTEFHDVTADEPGSIVRQVNEEEFRKRFFVELMHMQCYTELHKVVEVAWALALLRDVALDKETVLRWGHGQRPKIRERLKTVAGAFQSGLVGLLRDHGLEKILQTSWVNEPSWSKIRADMVTFQSALADDRQWAAAVRNCIAETVESTLTILDVT